MEGLGILQYVSVIGDIRVMLLFSPFLRWAFVMYSGVSFPFCFTPSVVSGILFTLLYIYVQVVLVLEGVVEVIHTWTETMQ